MFCPHQIRRNNELSSPISAQVRYKYVCQPKLKSCCFSRFPDNTQFENCSWSPLNRKFTNSLHSSIQLVLLLIFTKKIAKQILTCNSLSRLCFAYQAICNKPIARLFVFSHMHDPKFHITVRLYFIFRHFCQYPCVTIISNFSTKALFLVIC